MTKIMLGTGAVAPQGICVCDISPGIVANEMCDAAFGAGAKGRAGMAGVPTGCASRPEEIAEAAPSRRRLQLHVSRACC